MNVYRVEHKRYRHGPYHSESIKTKRCQAISNQLNAMADMFDRHPTPSTDDIDFTTCDYCGFESVEQLLDWFEDTLDELIEHNYHVAVFNIPKEHVKKGRRQVVFPRKGVRRKSVISLEEIQHANNR